MSDRPGESGGGGGSGRPAGSRILAALVRLFPRRFRERHADDLVECYLDAWEEGRAGRGVIGGVRFWIGAYGATMVEISKQWGMKIRTPMGHGREVGMGWDGWVHDARIAARGLRRRPAFAAIVVLTLGIGLGANVAVYSVLHSVLLAPLPYEDAGRLVRVYGNRLDTPGENERLDLSAPAALELRDEVPSLAGMAILQTSAGGGADLTGGDRPERVHVLPVNADYFAVLGWTPVGGRFFEREEEVEGRPVAVVREDIWRRHLGGEAATMGRTLTIDGAPVPIVGVVSDAHRDPLEGLVDIWVPTNLGADVAGNWSNNYLSGVARLAPGAAASTLRAELDVIEARHARMSSNAAEKGFTVVPLREDLVGDSRPLLAAVMGAVFFLLVLTCVNVASLLLSRAASREREMAIRSSLGSPGYRLVRTFVLESAFLALAAGVGGVVIGLGALQLIMAVAPPDLPRLEGIFLGPPAIALAGVASVGIGLLLGLATSLPFVRAPVTPAFSGGRSAGGGGSGRPRLRASLVAVEVALAVVLLTGATALLRSVQELRSQDLGIEPTGVLTFTVGLPAVRYDSDEALHRFSEAFHERALGVPGVISVGATSRLPVTGSYNTWGTRRAHAPDAPYDVDNIQVNQRWVAGDLFATVGLELVAGRAFDPASAPDTPYEVIVNETLAARVFGEEDPLGSWLTYGGRYGQVVGIVEDEALTPRAPAAPMAYHHQRQWISGNRQMTQVARVAGDPTEAVPALREALRQVDPDLILFEPVPFVDVLGSGMARETFAASLLTAFAALAALLASLGLYGVMIHHVGRQRHEIGIRMALGADATGVVRMVVRRGMRLAIIGAGIGVVMALTLADALRALLFQVDPRDPRLLVIAPVVLVVVAGLSSLLPARRAAGVDPLSSLRAD